MKIKELEKFEDIIKYCKNLEEIKDVRKEELRIWPIIEGHWFKFVKINDKWEIIDLEFAGLIKALNKSGLRTTFCCAGHSCHSEETSKGWCSGYISFEATEETKNYIGRLSSAFLDIDIDKNDVKFMVERFNTTIYAIRLYYRSEKREEILKKFENIALKNIRP